MEQQDKSTSSGLSLRNVGKDIQPPKITRKKPSRKNGPTGPTLFGAPRGIAVLVILVMLSGFISHITTWIPTIYIPLLEAFSLFHRLAWMLLACQIAPHISNTTVITIQVLWLAGTMLCAFGLLKGKNIARWIFLGLCGIHAVIFMWFMIPMGALVNAAFRLMTIAPFMAFGQLLDFFWPLFVVIAYVIYLSLPSVREWFEG